MKIEKMILSALILVFMLSITPVGAYHAVNDAFTVINSPDAGARVDILQNDIPRPDLSMITSVEITENPSHGSVKMGPDEPYDYLYYFPGYDLERDPRPWNVYFGPDSFKYRIYDGHSYSNEATVYLNVVPLGNGDWDPRIWFYTPTDTKLSIDSDHFLGGGMRIDFLEHPVSGPNHGKLTVHTCFEADDVCFEYLPDAGFKGWDSFTIRPWMDSGNYGECPGKLMDIAVYVGPEPRPTPEFPSALLPATLIIGFLGAVLFIRRTREQ